MTWALSVSTSQAQDNSSSDKDPQGDPVQWHWKLIKASMHESILGIYHGKHLTHRYHIGCHLDYQEEDLDTAESSKIEKVISTNNNDGLLLLTCIQGAHSKLIEIYDPKIEQSAPVFSQYGAYYAGWEKRDGQLIIYYDQACQSTSNDCLEYQRVEFKWPKEIPDPIPSPEKTDETSFLCRK